MSVDAPFQSGNPAGLERTDLSYVWPLDCTTYTLADQAEPRARPAVCGGIYWRFRIIAKAWSTGLVEAQLEARDETNSTLAANDSGARPGRGQVELRLVGR